ncbi:hypothetical protein AVEN_231454-1 [Araneus ventricosus]|uniref:Uncharacterized protein n=1 Tax=Araneus ventricosus TaxID=182803 RepID=A0A4Y2WTT1_ARAVE|nr:hypothetical protein AVEN_231454-1 [Araneus ventricosus]
MITRINNNPSQWKDQRVFLQPTAVLKHHTVSRSFEDAVHIHRNRAREPFFAQGLDSSSVGRKRPHRQEILKAPVKPGLLGRMRLELDSPNLGGDLPHRDPLLEPSLKARKMGCDGQG